MILLTGLVLGLHVISVSLASVGPLVAGWCDIGLKGHREVAESGGRFMARAALWGLVVGSLLGLLLGYLGWSDSFRVALRLLRRKLEWGGVEWLFSLVLMIVLAVWWSRVPRLVGGRRWLRALLGLLAGTNLLYHFTFLFFILEELERQPTAQPVDPALFREYMVRSRTLAHVLHFTLAAAVITGTAWIYSAWRRHRSAGSSEASEASDDDQAVSQRLAVWGGRLALLPAVGQLVVGFWLVFELPRKAQQAMMGRDMTATIGFSLAVLLALWMMHLLASTALGKASPGRWKLAVLVVVVVVILMSIVGESIQVREAAEGFVLGGVR